MRTASILKEAGLPTKTSWEKGKGEPAPDSTTGGNIQLSREMRWAVLGGLRLRVPHKMVLNACTEAAVINEGNDINEEPMRSDGMVGG